MNVQAAAISVAGNNMIIVLVDMGLVNSHGEADMTIDTLGNHFGDVPVVLMAQREDGSPVYYGDEPLTTLLRDVPVEKMPWKEYPVPT